RIHVNPSRHATRRAVAITETASLRAPVGDLGPDAVVAPYGDHDAAVCVILARDPRRGPLFISQFDDGKDAAITGIDVFRLVPLGPQVEPTWFSSLPPLSAWAPL